MVFAIVHRPAGDIAVTFTGMSQSEVQAMIAAQGLTVDVVNQATFDAFVTAHQPVPLTPAEVLALQRAQALDNLTSDQPVSKLERAIFLVVLDEINLIRGLLVPAQPPRTLNQFRNAVQNKINTGAAD